MPGSHAAARLGQWLRADRRFKLLLIESWFYLAWARWLKALPFKKVAPRLGDTARETARAAECDKDTAALIGDIAKSVRIMSRYTMWESKCLVKAIACMKMLQKRGIESTLYLGTAKDEQGKMTAHAWLRSGDAYLTGEEIMDRYAVVAVIGNFARRRKPITLREKGARGERG
ncbi:lasso peptide biosynthesis B2 protein [Paenibacillus sp. NEAU-GSW1]|uniref:lasso peptide biosynthesis B2 protein n=1 Tax=Paenibacillus sp. NEAU-GSW1 TaxID=2682486 RepID=UPI0012E322ED|nr:lasso peptide biosynthesis B2 protein [Paenibacillus sp. NEAU-GSW1]MUT68059.1 lasso peptide biosynthesis B2 protein [Paenibacillus sp. NEAU-GSW1]